MLVTLFFGSNASLVLFPGILISLVEKLTLASPSSRLIISPNYPGEAISGGASHSESHGKLLL